MEAAPALARRPIKARDSRWAAAAASFLAGHGATPDAISIASIAFAGIAALAFLALRFDRDPLARAAFFAVAIAGIQGRLVCNLLDGMVAIEGGKKTKSGGVFNELPDRISDPLIIVPAGYAISSLPYSLALAWFAALMAVMTAYVRALGRTMGTPDFFSGPMAKQHRMATLTIACALCVPASFWSLDGLILYVALVAIAAGCVITVIRRTMLIVRTLENQ
jgi:phosphatidylglycerophosphate synthase